VGLHTSTNPFLALHRDLKPENILMKGKDSLEPVLVDWGDTIFVGPKQVLQQSVGTYHWMDPQVMRCGQRLPLTRCTFDAYPVPCGAHDCAS
jgi:serine/threonine protein kinase